MLKQSTGEPCAGELHARFGGKGEKSSLPLSALQSCFLCMASPLLHKNHNYKSAVVGSVKRMKKLVIVILKALILIMSLAVVIGVASNLSVANVIMGTASLVFFYVIWLAVDTLNGPSNLVKERLLQTTNKVKPLLLYSIVGVVLYKLISLLAEHA